MTSLHFTHHNHGGQLVQASKGYQIPLDDWLDLSTGISPITYSLPKVPEACWNRLPESNDGLEIAAANYYGSNHLLAVSGSQEAIQKLPLLFDTQSTVGIVAPAYHSHEAAWKGAGHTIVYLKDNNNIDEKISSLDVLIIVNPTNPSCQTYSQDVLLKWHKILNKNNGTLVIDEAFIDATSDNSMITKDPVTGLIVLRSIGKFFGLAGIRLGFIWAESSVLQKLAVLQDDWSVSHPARWAGRTALTDKQWQDDQIEHLHVSSMRLQTLLTDFLSKLNERNQSTSSKNTEETAKSGGVQIDTSTNDIQTNIVRFTALFAYFEHTDATVIHEALAKQGILVRLFSYSSTQLTINHNRSALRFGLPSTENDWQRLEQALSHVCKSC